MRPKVVPLPVLEAIISFTGQQSIVILIRMIIEVTFAEVST
jgi:hypothetical protein